MLPVACPLLSGSWMSLTHPSHEFQEIGRAWTAQAVGFPGLRGGKSLGKSSDQLETKLLRLPWKMAMLKPRKLKYIKMFLMVELALRIHFLDPNILNRKVDLMSCWSFQKLLTFHNSKSREIPIFQYVNEKRIRNPWHLRSHHRVDLLRVDVKNLSEHGRETENKSCENGPKSDQNAWKLYLELASMRGFSSKIEIP